MRGCSDGRLDVTVPAHGLAVLIIGEAAHTALAHTADAHTASAPSPPAHSAPVAVMGRGVTIAQGSHAPL